MSNPHNRAHYPYQNDNERFQETTGTVAAHSPSRSELASRDGPERSGAEDDRLYRAAHADLRRDETLSSGHAPNEREMAARHGHENNQGGPGFSSSSSTLRHATPAAFGAFRPHPAEEKVHDAVAARPDPWREIAAAVDTSGVHSPPTFQRAGQDLHPWRSNEAAPAARYPDDFAPPGVKAMPARDRRGPKGYVRSDDRIREEICERLLRDARLELGEVSVEVQDGRVLLSGAVPERRMKHAVEDIADDCWGVKEIDNRLRVVRVEPQERENAPSVWRARLGKES